MIFHDHPAGVPHDHGNPQIILAMDDHDVCIAPWWLRIPHDFGLCQVEHLDRGSLGNRGWGCRLEGLGCWMLGRFPQGRTDSIIEKKMVIICHTHSRLILVFFVYSICFIHQLQLLTWDTLLSPTRWAPWHQGATCRNAIWEGWGGPSRVHHWWELSQLIEHHRTCLPMFADIKRSRIFVAVTLHIIFVEFHEASDQLLVWIVWNLHSTC